MMTTTTTTKIFGTKIRESKGAFLVEVFVSNEKRDVADIFGKDMELFENLQKTAEKIWVPKSACYFVGEKMTIENWTLVKKEDELNGFIVREEK